jgi:hypothetical protein
MIRLPRRPAFASDFRPGMPPAHTARARRRFAAMLREATAVVDRLPEPGESLHFLLSGTYDLATMLGYLVTSRNVPCLEMVLATLAFSSRNTHELCGLVDAGAVVKLSLLCSDFHAKHSPTEYAEAVQEFGKRGLPLAVARCHAKIAALHFADGMKLALETSANLRTNSNVEAATLFNDPGVWEFHRAWIGAKHHEWEVKQSTGDAAR